MLLLLLLPQCEPRIHNFLLWNLRNPNKMIYYASSIDSPSTLLWSFSVEKEKMADKPSRGLVLYGDGLARFVDPTHTHLHSLASLACCGFLSLPHSPPSGSISLSLSVSHISIYLSIYLSIYIIFCISTFLLLKWDD